MKIIGVLAKALIGLLLALVVFSMIFAFFFLREPTGGTGVSSPLDVSPASPIKGTPGILLIRPGKEITAAYTVTNTTNDTSVSRRIGISAQGPRACELEWNAPSSGFGATEFVVLKPNESFKFVGKQTFTQPGLYFMETNRQTMDGNWGGFGRRVDRVYFIVGDENTLKSVDSSCVADKSRLLGQPIVGTPTAQPTSKP